LNESWELIKTCTEWFLSSCYFKEDTIGCNVCVCWFCRYLFYSYWIVNMREMREVIWSLRACYGWVYLMPIYSIRFIILQILHEIISGNVAKCILHKCCDLYSFLFYLICNATMTLTNDFLFVYIIGHDTFCDMESMISLKPSAQTVPRDFKDNFNINFIIV